MIEAIKKILKKITKDISKYQVCVYRWADKKSPDECQYRAPSFLYCEVCFVHEDNAYRISLKENKELYIVLDYYKKDDSSIGKDIRCQVQENDKYEILDLFHKLKQECENFTASMFKEFADFSATDDNSDLS